LSWIIIDEKNDLGTIIPGQFLAEMMAWPADILTDDDMATPVNELPDGYLWESDSTHTSISTPCSKDYARWIKETLWYPYSRIWGPSVLIVEHGTANVQAMIDAFESEGPWTSLMGPVPGPQEWQAPSDQTQADQPREQRDQDGWSGHLAQDSGDLPAAGCLYRRQTIWHWLKTQHVKRFNS
jgi:hypothetical protein